MVVAVGPPFLMVAVNYKINEQIPTFQPSPSGKSSPIARPADEAPIKVTHHSLANKTS